MPHRLESSAAPLERYLESLRAGVAEFLAAHRSPFLVLEMSTAARGTPSPSSKVGRTAHGGSKPFFQIDRRAAPIAKRDGASPSAVVTLGRGAGNDIVVVEESLSKFHAYFSLVDGAYRIADAGSRNGTTVGGVRLEPRVARILADFDEVRFGEAILARFLLPASFVKFLQWNAARPAKS